MKRRRLIDKDTQPAHGWLRTVRVILTFWWSRQE
jgi:hypothetical protein